MLTFFASRAGATALVALSIVYGGLVALLGAFAPSALTPVAFGGALVIGILWALRALVVRSRADAG